MFYFVFVSVVPFLGQAAAPTASNDCRTLVSPVRQFAQLHFGKYICCLFPESHTVLFSALLYPLFYPLLLTAYDDL
ncbi:hypothetical protein DFP73DRAFT_567696 [Morchella snyderi]|nr:hypothetical protein DFP73DRAFT_567696 [Morchella snyderi]